ncbi:Arginine N-methyltransferase 2 [Basidiobolus ranarum]|uniref:Arginine N-methyltransferase 2 n=1 Tax=Basidiobolus ranarum TaxID=34480 RepID=A0ABR2VU81_9FUNG
MSEESKNIEENLITEESNIENVPLDQLDQLDPEQLAKLGYEIVKKTEADVARDESLLLKSGEGDLEAVKALLKEGADVWHRDEAGKSPLHAACSGGHLKVVNELLQAGHQWNAVDNSGKSTGEYASENGHDQMRKKRKPLTRITYLNH